MLGRLVASCALLSLTIPAQSTPCLSYNDSNTNVSTSLTGSPFVGLNPNSRAYQFTPSTTIAAQAASIFTGSPLHDDYMRLEIWSDDTANQQPMTRLAVGTMASPLSANASWLGTDFDTAVGLVAGTNYWLVWIDAGGSIIPEEPSGTALPSRSRATTNPWGPLTSGAVKFRLYCNLLDGQGVVPFGNPCATSSGQLPTLFTNQPPMSGNSAFSIEGTNLVPMSNVALVLGLDPMFVPQPLSSIGLPAGCALNTDPFLVIPKIATAGVAEIGDQPSNPRPLPFGYIQVKLPMTNIAAGGFFSAQLFDMDSGSSAAIPLVSTNALQISTF